MNAADFEPDPVLVELVEAARAEIVQQTKGGLGLVCWGCGGALGASDGDSCATCRLARAIAAYDAEAECPRD